MKFDKAPFSPSGEYDARKPFTFQGELVPPGGRFDWRRLGVSGRKLRQLWDNGFIVPTGSPSGLPVDDSDPGDEARAKRVEAGKKSAEARKAKKAAALEA